MEEKMQYQSEERLRDVHEMLESCQTRVRVHLLILIPSICSRTVQTPKCFSELVCSLHRSILSSFHPETCFSEPGCASFD